MNPARLAAWLCLAVCSASAAFLTFNVYQNVVNLRDDRAALDQALVRENAQAAELNYEYLLSQANLLQEKGRLQEAKKAYERAAADKPLISVQQPTPSQTLPAKTSEYVIPGFISFVALVASLALFGLTKESSAR